MRLSRMGTGLNFGGFGGGGGRGSSIFSLTLDELQSSVGGSVGRDLGSMNMDELLKNIWSAEETHSGVGASSGGGLQKQGSSRTLKEISLEEFLVRAGVVREDVLNANTSSGFQGLIEGAGNHIHVQAHINVNGARCSQQPHQKPQLFPNQPALPGYAGPQLASPRMRGGVVGISAHTNMVQGAGTGMVGLGAGSVNIVNESSPSQLSSDGVGKSNGDLTSVCPVPYMFNGGMRGRRATGAMEKVVERRQRRMIKNRESAARSRARKQAYTMELEAEVAKLKAENQELQQKHDEFMKLEENQVTYAMLPPGPKRQCLLRRSQSSSLW